MNQCLKGLTIKTDDICSNCDLLIKCSAKMRKRLDRKIEKLTKKIEANYIGALYGAVENYIKKESIDG